MASKRVPNDVNRLVEVDESTAWYAARYENCARDVSRYIGTTQPTFSELCAVRFSSWLNGDLSLDWTFESCTITLVRELGPGFRFGHLLASLYMVVISTLYLGRPLVFEYGLEHKETDMRMGNFTVAIAFYLWALNLAIVAIALFLSRRGSKLSNDSQLAQMTPFYRPLVYYLREERPELEARQTQSAKYCQTASMVVSFLLYAAFYILGVLSMHTMLAHMYNQKNVWFAVLIGLTALMDGISTADDLTQIGTPWGVQESSPWASRLLAIRGCWIFPVSVVWMAAAIAASFPPSWCADC
tara:strand:+ start:2259 stop:3155 length:897 start_codon:yes stop_codon:yes gene_type:complete